MQRSYTVSNPLNIPGNPAFDKQTVEQDTQDMFDLYDIYDEDDCSAEAMLSRYWRTKPK